MISISTPFRTGCDPNPYSLPDPQPHPLFALFLLVSSATHAQTIPQRLSSPPLALAPLSRASFYRSRRAALAECLRDLDAGRTCATLPTPRRNRVIRLPPATYNLTSLRRGVFLYDDGAYLTLILARADRLAIVDFPDSAGSNPPNGTGTLLTTAIDEVLAGRTPARVDMVYSHEHFDHIGGATRVRALPCRQIPARIGHHLGDAGHTHSYRPLRHWARAEAGPPRRAQGRPYRPGPRARDPSAVLAGTHPVGFACPHPACAWGGGRRYDCRHPFAGMVTV